MLSIQKRTVERRIQIGDLFSEFGILHTEEVEARCDFDIAVLTPAGYKQIEALGTTETLQLRKVRAGNRELIAADRHIVMSGIKEEPFSTPGWRWLRDLSIGDMIVDSNGQLQRIESNELTGESDILYDLQVADVHCFYTNGLLSHNSHMLVNFGAWALRKGKNVLHYTFELSETKVGIRYDSNLCNIPSNDVISNKELIQETYDKMKLGRLIIKEYPSGSASIVTLRAHIEKLLMRSFKPHLILIDYADIMRSSRSYDSMRHELALIYVELRNLSQELGVPIWTASQANRDSANADIVGLENMAEAYGKAMVADVVISLSRKAKEKSTGFGRMFVAKNRAGKDGLLFHIKMDTARSLIRAANPDEEQTFEEAVEEDEAYAKGRLRDRYNQLKKELAQENSKV